MPAIELNITHLEKAVGKKLDFDQLQYDLQWISLDVDDVDKEANTIKVEYNPNRPDFSSPEGIARVLKGYYDLELGLPKFEVNKGKEIMHVDASVRKIRPYVVCGVVRFDFKLNEEQIIMLMHMQEHLHWALGRDRKKVAIGIHDWEAVKGPYRYTTVEPDGVKFRPLHLEAYEMTPQDILEEHPMGKQYAHLLEGFDRYPIIFDNEGKVVSFPPIINGVYTTVTPDKTSILMLDLTGTSKEAVDFAINIIATTFADMGGHIETAEVIYEDEPENARFTPDLTPFKWTIHIDYINSYTGLNLSAKDMIHCLEKVRMAAKITKDKNILEVLVPAYRVDIMHEVDFAEEVAIGYGYQNLPIKVNEGGFGAYHPADAFANLSRNIMVGSGSLEMVNSILCSQNDYERFGKTFVEKENIIISNPVSEEYNTVRTDLMVGLMKNLQNNRSGEKPFRLFEVGDVVLFDKKEDTGARRELHMSGIVHSDQSDYTEIKSVCDHYFRTIGKLNEIEIKPVKNPSFIEGRVGDIFYNKKRIGTIGEVHPQIILNFGLEYPTAVFEIDLTPFWQKLEK